jgi:phospholipase D1/2
MIQGWWFTPELYLRRPPAQNPEWRLDRLLKRKAEQGVKVYVIIYKEVCIVQVYAVLGC